jgi:site-specific recombinase XerD
MIDTVVGTLDRATEQVTERVRKLQADAAASHTRDASRSRSVRPAEANADPQERRQFGTLRLRGRIWWVRYKVNGTCYEESSGSTDRRKAEKLLARREAELGLGSFTAPDVKRTTMEHLAQILRDDYRVNGRRSLRRAETSMAHLLDHFGAARAVTVTADRIAAYIRERQDAGAAPATIRNELAALKRMFTLGVRAGKVAQRPYIPAIQVSNARQGFFNADDFAAALAELPEHLQPVVAFEYYTGWRGPSEVLPLTWEQVDFAAGVVRLELRTTKNDEGRTFPFDVLPDLKLLLEAQREHTRSVERRLGRIVPLVFHHDGERIGRFDKAWKSALDRAAHEERQGVRVVVRPQLLTRVPHDFRRTAVRNLVRAGVPEHIAMKLTGHKTRSVFDRYDIVNERDLRDGVTKLAALHAAAPALRRGTTGGQ